MSDIVIVWYSTWDDEYRYSLELDSPHYNLTRPIEQQDVAARCAKDYRDEHDGWESKWPIDFTIYESEDGPALATFTVEQDFEPVFYARRKP